MNSALSYTLFETPLGWCSLVGSRAGIKRVFLPGPDRASVLGRVLKTYPESRRRDTDFEKEKKQLESYLGGSAPDFSVSLDWTGVSAFQKAVWLQVRCIPRGRVRTYGWVAGRIGKPGAARAIGNALGKNPFPIIVPCHRVIRADGAPGGFSAAGGSPMKRRLLVLEGVSLQK